MGGQCCYCFPQGICCGRPFLVGGAARLAPVVTRSDWRTPADPDAGAPPWLTSSLRARIARAWVDDAAMEHASVAAFSRFSLELLAVGAPAALVAGAQRAGLDEVAHAQACFAMATRYGAVSPGPGGLSLAGLVIAEDRHDSVGLAFVEGCIGETVAAVQAGVAAAACHDAEARAVLERIAADEARHAVLAWDYIAWALRQDMAGITTVVGEVLAAYRASTDEAACAATEAAAEPAETRAAMNAAGRLTDRQRASLQRRTFEQVVEPAARALGLFPQPLSAAA